MHRCQVLIFYSSHCPFVQAGSSWTELQILCIFSSQWNMTNCSETLYLRQAPAHSTFNLKGWPIFNVVHLPLSIINVQSINSSTSSSQSISQTSTPRIIMLPNFSVRLETGLSNMARSCPWQTKLFRPKIKCDQSKVEIPNPLEYKQSCRLVGNYVAPISDA